LGDAGTFGVVACVQEVAVTPSELLADADLLQYTMVASEKAEEEAIRKASDHRSQTPQVDANNKDAKTRRES